MLRHKRSGRGWRAGVVLHGQLLGVALALDGEGHGVASRCRKNPLWGGRGLAGVRADFKAVAVHRRGVVAEIPRGAVEADVCGKRLGFGQPPVRVRWARGFGDRCQCNARQVAHRLARGVAHVEGDLCGRLARECVVDDRAVRRILGVGNLWW